MRFLSSMSCAALVCTLVGALIAAQKRSTTFQLLRGAPGGQGLCWKVKDSSGGQGYVGRSRMSREVKNCAGRSKLCLKIKGSPGRSKLCWGQGLTVPGGQPFCRKIRAVLEAFWLVRVLPGGQELCATDLTNMTSKVIQSKLQCAWQCIGVTGCAFFNYKNSDQQHQVCDHYTSYPQHYQIIANCSHYQVMLIWPWSNGGMHYKLMCINFSSGLLR
jgi:hypothetical protein